MKALKKILIVLGILLALVIIVGFFLPAKYHAERSIVIKTPPSVPFNQVNTMKNWENWSPFYRKDPKMALTYDGPPSGTGAKYSWVSQKSDLGSGTLTVSESVPDSIVGTAMAFKGRGDATASFHFSRVPEGTKVTWGMDGDAGMNLMGRYMGMMMDKIMGPTFDDGLRNLKEVSEKAPAAGNDIKVEETTSKDMHAVMTNIKCPTAEMDKAFPVAYQKVMDHIKKNKLKEAGPFFAVYNSFNQQNVDFDLGIPVEKPAKTEGDIKAAEIKPGKVLKVVYTGKYSGLEPVHTAINNYAREHGKTISGKPWEVYLNSPMTEKDSSKLMTEVYYPVK